ncbi:hypothetical protein D3C71_1097510 [compost metagenome]
MAHRRGDHFIDELMNGVIVGVFKHDANDQHQDHHQQGGDQRGERFLHRRRHAVWHFDHQIFALQPAEQFRPQQRTNHCHEQPLAANPFDRHDGYAAVLRDFDKWREDQEANQRQDPARDAVFAVMFRQTEGNQEADKQRHGREDGVKRDFNDRAPAFAKGRGHKLLIRLIRERGDHQQN